MLTGRRFWTFAMVLVLCAIVTAGCRKRGSRRTVIVTGSDIFTTDEFPGAPVQNGNVADDKRAMSPALGRATGLKVTFNGDRCTAMVTYYVAPGLFGGPVGLYAHYYDGETWTPPVLLQTIDSDPTTVDSGSVVHVALNTENHPSEAAQDRNGDWMIFFRTFDVDTDGGGPDASNRTLQYVYFNEEYKDSASRRHGFQEFSTRIDAEDELAENVMLFGVVSDGLCGQAGWSDGGNNYRWGDDVTAVVVFFVQRENNDGGAGFDDRALYTVRFDPAEAAAADVPLTPFGPTRMPIDTLGASDIGTSSEETQVEDVELALSYNNNLFFKVFARNPFPLIDDLPSMAGYGFPVSSGEDVVIQNIRFNLATGAFDPAVSFTSAITTAADGLMNQAGFLDPDGSSYLGFNEVFGRSIYGSDEGLAAIVFFHVRLSDDFGLNAIFGSSTSNSGRLILADAGEAAGGLPWLDTPIDLEQPFIPDHVWPYRVDTRISRNGDYIWVAWLEALDLGGSADDMCFAVQYTTTRIDSDGGFPPILSFVDSVSGVLQLNVDIDGQPVTWFAFQDGLGYVCGAQSDPDEMQIFMEQSSGTFDEVDQAELFADIVPPGATPGFVTSIAEVSNPGEDGDYAESDLNNAGFNFKGTDGGEDGDVFYVYREDIDIVGDDFRCSTESDGAIGGFAFIDSFVFFRMIPPQAFTFINLPPGEEVGYFDVVDLTDDEERTHANQFVHVIFYEDQVSEVDTYHDALRTRQFNCGDRGETYIDSFVPEAGAVYFDPFQLTLPSIAEDHVPSFIVAVGRHQNVAGVVFHQGLRVYYQECETNADGIGWHLADDADDDLDADVITPAGDPFLVDDDDERLVDFLFGIGIAAYVQSCSCDTLSCMFIFWTKTNDILTFPGLVLESRLQVRVRSAHDGHDH